VADARKVALSSSPACGRRYRAHSASWNNIPKFLDAAGALA
jgi:hypothetical protein